MLAKAELQRVRRLAKEMDDTDARRRFQACRDILHFYEDVVVRRGAEATEDKAFAALKARAGEAFLALGGLPEPVSVSLRAYRHDLYGPYLGVSDEGSAAGRIRDAFLKSPKGQVLGRPDPLQIGGAVDAERLGGAGEVPVGPEEYCQIQLDCVGRVLTTTNVGTRVNLRYYNNPPSLTIALAEEKAAAAFAVEKATALLAPYLHTPDGKPVATTLFVSFTLASGSLDRAKVIGALQRAMRRGSFCDPALHTLGLLIRVPRGSREAAKVAGEGIDLAAKTGIAIVAVNGVLRRSAQERISLPGLLNFFDKTTLNRLLAKAAGQHVALRAWKIVDTDSVARNTWTALNAARSSGLYLGKYGMQPLTMAEADYVIGKLQPWFRDWSAAPAIYVDCPAVAEERCYDERDGAAAIPRWLDIAAKHGVPVVLIDTADKSKGRKLLKDGPDDKVGILSEREVLDLDAYARKRAIKALWAGGISAAQAYRFGSLGVFGIYTTTATARKTAVHGDYAHDPALPNEREPTYRGVCRVALLLQAGFLQNKLRARGDAARADGIARSAKALLAAQEGGLPEERERALQQTLSQTLQAAWRIVLRQAPAK